MSAGRDGDIRRATLDPERKPTRFEDALGFWFVTRTRRVVGVIAVFLAIALVAASQVYLNWRQANVDVQFLPLLALKIGEWMLWASLVPLVFAVDRRWGFAAGHPLVGTAVHLLLAVSWFAILNGLMTAAAPLVDPLARREDFWTHYLIRASQRWPNQLVIYSLILAVPSALGSVLQRERLERELAEARLQNLRLQLQPHFLFNTLHTIGALVRSGERGTAVHTISALADLLRRALSHVESEKVTVGEEMEFLDRYSTIQGIRFGSRLTIRTCVAEDCRGALIPSMILQPLVENAIRHGIEPVTSRGTIRIDIERRTGSLAVSVTDNGAGFRQEVDETGWEGIGLSTTKRRLRALYGGRHRLSISSDGAGCVVAFSIPFET